MSDDLIKRSDALSAAGDMSYIAFEIRKKLRMIPSAEPMPDYIDNILIVRHYCNGMVAMNEECYKRLQTRDDSKEGKWEVDAIDRDALIDYCLKLIDVERKQGSDVMNYGQERVNQTEAIINYIEHMPHVYADRPQGEWIDKGRNLWGCSNCGMEIYSESEQDRNEFHKWCSRCGCRMKGADDE